VFPVVCSETESRLVSGANLGREIPRELAIRALQPHISRPQLRMASRSGTEPSLVIMHAT
jgi:hypothetical protein